VVARMGVCYLHHSVYLSVYPHIPALLPLDRFPRNVIQGTLTKIYQENPNFIKIWQKYRAFI